MRAQNCREWGQEQAMKLQDFDFELPEAQIALRPMVPRGAAKLLVQDGDRRIHATVADLPDFLRAGDRLVFNDTRVLPARLEGQRMRGLVSARVEITLTEDQGEGTWRALARPARKLKAGDHVTFGGGLSCEVTDNPKAGQVTLRFDRSGPDFMEALAQAGVMPLPPYIASKRAADAQDLDDYQPIFARNDGAIAAPTASLHFDHALVAALDAAGIARSFVTLHVGIGTFLPVKVDNIADHVMHAEWGEVTAATAHDLNRTREEGGRIIAVGTTALRLLETAADETGRIRPYRDQTDIFITPGYRFRAVDGLITNFHLPQSTLLMLVAALVGMDRMKDIYADAIALDYRFFSYGDASLLIP